MKVNEYKRDFKSHYVCWSVQVCKSARMQKKVGVVVVYVVNVVVESPLLLCHLLLLSLVAVLSLVVVSQLLL